MPIPSWSTSMVRNYREQFRCTHGRETTLTDEQIFNITKTVFDDDSAQAQDKARVEVMFDTETKP